MREGVVFYRSFVDAIRGLPPEEFKLCALAILDYGLDGKEPEGTGIDRTVFCMAKPQIDANNRRYENGTKGGRPITKANLDVTKNNQTITKANLDVTKPEPKDKEKDKEKDKDYVKEKHEKEKPPYTAVFEELWKAYPRRKDKALAYKAYKARLNDGFSEDELITAVKRYAEECQRQRTEERYIKHCSTFLGVNTPFMDYMKKEEDDEPENSCSVRLW